MFGWFPWTDIVFVSCRRSVLDWRLAGDMQANLYAVEDRYWSGSFRVYVKQRTGRLAVKLFLWRLESYAFWRMVSGASSNYSMMM